MLWRWTQILVELAELQDQEVGDGTTSVVIVAAELLKRANELVRQRIHPTSIISGYRIAMREVRPTAAQPGSPRSMTGHLPGVLRCAGPALPPGDDLRVCGNAEGAAVV